MTLQFIISRDCDWRSVEAKVPAKTGLAETGNLSPNHCSGRPPTFTMAFKWVDFMQLKWKINWNTTGCLVSAQLRKH